MTTEKQLRANQANAANSTGPRTEAGKAKSATNALKHGLTAERAVIPGEDPAEYAAFQDRLASELGVEGALEVALVDRLASTLWRLRRIPYLETAFFAYSQHKRLWDMDLTLDPILELPGPAAALHDKTWAPWKKEDREILKSVGRIVEDALSANVLPKLSTYEARLSRQAEKLLRELERLRKQRGVSASGSPVAPGLDPGNHALTIDHSALDSGRWASLLWEESWPLQSELGRMR